MRRKRGRSPDNLKLTEHNKLQHYLENPCNKTKRGTTPQVTLPMLIEMLTNVLHAETMSYYFHI